MASDPLEPAAVEPIHDQGLAARFRAAWTYAGVRDKDAAAHLGIGLRTFNRKKYGGSPITESDREITLRVTSVPTWFLAHGFEPPPADDDPDLAS